LVKTQLKLRKIKDDHELKRIERKATQEDLGLWHTARMREDGTLREARAIIRRIGISMKLTDVEFQGDNGRATFYYISEQRVDFRELVRELARTFDIRVDMRQIGARQEAARVGGIGVCGRELCCTSWLKDFRSVSTGAARYQQLSLNPGKLAGQCGKLKCCLNFELDQYVEAVKEFPSPNAKIKTPKGKAVVFKMDIFKRLVYLLELGEPGASPVAVSVEDANALIAASERGEVAQGLQSFVIEDEPDEVDETFGNVVGQEDLTRFDEAKRRSRGKGRRQGGRSGQRSRQGGNDAPASAKSESGSSKGEGSKGGGASGRKSSGRSRGKRRGGGGNSGAPNASNG
jgi:cell fate regulator YaaT (PSP1 superfamily)